ISKVKVRDRTSMTSGSTGSGRFDTLHTLFGSETTLWTFRICRAFSRQALQSGQMPLTVLLALAMAFRKCWDLLCAVTAT
ncbi:Protein of unknown function, partial [Gryllus bimaculatus]